MKSCQRSHVIILYKSSVSQIEVPEPMEFKNPVIDLLYIFNKNVLKVRWENMPQVLMCIIIVVFEKFACEYFLIVAYVK